MVIRETDKAKVKQIGKSRYVCGGRTDCHFKYMVISLRGDMEAKPGRRRVSWPRLGEHQEEEELEQSSRRLVHARCVLRGVVSGGLAADEFGEVTGTRSCGVSQVSYELWLLH